MGTIRSYDKQMRHLAHLLIGGGKKDGKKKLCSYYADKCLSCSDSLCANGVPEQNGTEHQNQMEGSPNRSLQSLIQMMLRKFQII